MSKVLIFMTAILSFGCEEVPPLSNIQDHVRTIAAKDIPGAEVHSARCVLDDDRRYLQWTCVVRTATGRIYEYKCESRRGGLQCIEDVSGQYKGVDQ